MVANPQIQEAAKVASSIALSLNKRGIQVTQGNLSDETLRTRARTGEFNLLIAIGGDGTMLRAGQICGPAEVPILGINVGRFGFLIEIQADQWKDILNELVDGKYWLEKRMMLRAEHWRGNSCLGAWELLNEVAVSRGEILRPVQLTAMVDGRFLSTYVADALIAATATGSTAYALAAGGPILPPELRNILLVPVAPHLSIDRAIVLAEGSSVGITINTDHQAVFSVDGQLPVPMLDNDRVEAYASEHNAQFIRFQDPGYFYRNLTPHMSQNPSTGNQR